MNKSEAERIFTQVASAAARSVTVDPGLRDRAMELKRFLDDNPEVLPALDEALTTTVEIAAEIPAGMSRAERIAAQAANAERLDLSKLAVVYALTAEAYGELVNELSSALADHDRASTTRDNALIGRVRALVGEAKGEGR